MIKQLALFFSVYVIILTIIYFSTIGNEFTPSSFKKYAMIVTPIYLLLFILFIYFKPKKNEK